MKNFRATSVICASLLAIFYVPAGHATLVWDWSFGGEAGTFNTTGELADLSGATVFDFVEGSFNVATTSVNATTKPTSPTLDYLLYAGSTGSLGWDGSNVSSIDLDLQGSQWDPGASEYVWWPYIYWLTPSSGKLEQWFGNSGGYIEVASGPITYTSQATTSSVPVPAAVWLFFSGLLGLVGVSRYKRAV